MKGRELLLLVSSRFLWWTAPLTVSAVVLWGDSDRVFLSQIDPWPKIQCSFLYWWALEAYPNLLSGWPSSCLTLWLSYVKITPHNNTAEHMTRPVLSKALKRLGFDRIWSLGSTIQKMQNRIFDLVTAVWRSLSQTAYSLSKFINGRDVIPVWDCQTGQFLCGGCICCLETWRKGHLMQIQTPQMLLDQLPKNLGGLVTEVW